MKIIVIDGQGGKIGSTIVSQLTSKNLSAQIIAIGTNSTATSAMMKSGASLGATGENPVIVNCKDADIIVGPLGIVIANSFLGELTPKMAIAIGKSKGKKILIPVNRCNNCVVGVDTSQVNSLVSLAVQKICEMLDSNSSKQSN